MVQLTSKCLYLYMSYSCNLQFVIFLSNYKLLASEASLSLVMSFEVKIYFIYIFIYLYTYVSTCYMDLWQNGKTDRRNDDAR